MSIRTHWLACLLIGGFLLAPATVQAQDIGNPVWETPLPLMWGDKDSGFYGAAEALFWRLNNPIGNQQIAFRGFYDQDGQIRGNTTGDIVTLTSNNGAVFLGTFFAEQGQPGALIGSGFPALNANQVSGEEFEPGWRLTFGYRFQDAIAIEFSCWQLSEFRYSAGAGPLPPNVSFRSDLADSFITAPFFNFSPFFSGPQRDVISDIIPVVRPPGATTVDLTGVPALPAQDLADLQNLRGVTFPAYGIWNAAENMTIQFQQRAFGGEITAKVPLTQTDNSRTYALIGPRYLNVLERFTMWTADADIDGQIDTADTATYTNEWETRFYGGQLGLGTDCYVGSGFALSLESRIGIFGTVHHNHVKIERGNLIGNVGLYDVGAQHEDNQAGIAPMFQGGAYLWWYPIEGVQLRAGYEFLGLFNVLRSRHPIDFDVGRLSPGFEERFMSFDGFTLGAAFIF